MHAVKLLSGKGLPAKDQDRALCRACYDALKSGSVQGIETGVGTMVKVQEGNRVKVQLRQSGSASIADAQPVTEGAKPAATDSGGAFQSFGKNGQTEEDMKAQFSNMTVAQFNVMRNCFDSMSDNSSM
jgi:hypothetical protein